MVPILVVGITFIALGIVTIIWPIVIVWLTAMVSILIGSMFLFAASFFAKNDLGKLIRNPGYWKN